MADLHEKVSGSTKNTSVRLLVAGFLISTFAAFTGLGSQYDEFLEVEAPRDGDERLLLRTESAFYYRFYEDLVIAPSYSQELTEFRRRSDIESNRTINTFARFNLAQEIVLAFLFRTFGQPLNVEAITFYVTSVLLLNSLLAGILFLWCAHLTGSGWVALSVPFFYLASLPAVTRACYLPALRENAGVVWTMLSWYLMSRLVTSTSQTSYTTLFWYGSAVALRNIFWQFSQVTLYVDVTCLSIVYVCGLVRPSTVRCISAAALAGSLAAFFLQQGNRLYLVSLPLWTLVTLVGLLSVTSHNRKWLQLGAAILGGVALRFLVSRTIGTQPDSHMVDFLNLKLFGTPSFDGFLYAADSAFQSLDWQFWAYMTESLVAPLAAIGIAHACFELRNDSGRRAEALWVLLTLAFSLGLATIARRFVVFLSPVLIVAAVYGASRIHAIFEHRHKRALAVLTILAVALLTFLDPSRHHRPVSTALRTDDLALMAYIGKELDARDVIYAPINRSGEIQLFTRRSTVLHPHYEDAEVRQRARNYYALYAYSQRDVIDELHRQYEFTHLLILKSLCGSDYGSQLAHLARGTAGRVADERVCNPSHMGDQGLEAVFENDLFILYAFDRD